MGNNDKDTLQEYLSTVEAIAREALEQDGDAHDFIAESVDGSYWVIYYHAAHKVWQYSDNEDALFDNFGSDALAGLDSMGAVLTRMAYCAMLADCEAKYAELEAEQEDEDEDDSAATV